MLHLGSNQHMVLGHFVATTKTQYYGTNYCSIAATSLTLNCCHSASR